MRGKLIVLTGIDGSGKTVQTKLLYEKLRKEGYPVETIDYPRYGKTFFADLVARYLRGEFGRLSDVSPYLAAPLFAGDRFETKDTLEGWLNDGKIILLNRYVVDNIAHQGARVPLPEVDKFIDWLTRLEHDVYKLPKADMNILLSLPPTIAYERVQQKQKRDYLKGKERDIHEDDLDYLSITSKLFHKLALQPDWKIVECVKGSNIHGDDNGIPLNEAVISERVWECVCEFLNQVENYNHNAEDVNKEFMRSYLA